MIENQVEILPLEESGLMTEMTSTGIVSEDEIRENYEVSRKNIVTALEDAQTLLKEVKETIKMAPGNMRAIEVGSKILSSINELGRTLSELHKASDFGIAPNIENLTLNSHKDEYVFNSGNISDMVENFKKSLKEGNGGSV